jgi:hypothetical protein
VHVVVPEGSRNFKKALEVLQSAKNLAVVILEGSRNFQKALKLLESARNVRAIHIFYININMLSF